jgi:hypothetical protein
MPKKMEDHLKEFTWKVMAVVVAALITTIGTSLFMGAVIVPQRLEAVEKQTNQNTCDIKDMQEETNAKIDKIYQILIAK